jgi:hypothetical protein
MLPYLDLLEMLRPGSARNQGPELSYRIPRRKCIRWTVTIVTTVTVTV